MSVGVIIPVRNAVATVTRTLRSLQRQTFRSGRAVVVDDGSEDRTAEVISALSAVDPRIRLLTTRQGGVSAARNIGVRHALGDYLLFPDADDWITPAHLERLVPVLAAEPRIGVVHCGWVRETGAGARWPEQYGPDTLDLFRVLARH